MDTFKSRDGSDKRVALFLIRTCLQIGLDNNVGHFFDISICLRSILRLRRQCSVIHSCQARIITKQRKRAALSAANVDGKQNKTRIRDTFLLSSRRGK